MNVKYVESHLLGLIILHPIVGYIVVRNRMNVMNAGNHLHRKATFWNTGEYIVEKDHAVAKYVESPTLRQAILLSINGNTVVKNHTNVAFVGNHFLVMHL